MGRTRTPSKVGPAAGSRARSGAEEVVDWLLDGDPSIRWQALRDLVGAPAARVAEERARVGGGVPASWRCRIPRGRGRAASPATAVCTRPSGHPRPIRCSSCATSGFRRPIRTRPGRARSSSIVVCNRTAASLTASGSRARRASPEWCSPSCRTSRSTTSGSIGSPTACWSSRCPTAAGTAGAAAARRTPRCTRRSARSRDSTTMGGTEGARRAPSGAQRTAAVS